jgi:hypothetical protein
MSNSDRDPQRPTHYRRPLQAPRPPAQGHPEWDAWAAQDHQDMVRDVTDRAFGEAELSYYQATGRWPCDD